MVGVFALSLWGRPGHREPFFSFSALEQKFIDLDLKTLIDIRGVPIPESVSESAGIGA